MRKHTGAHGELGRCRWEEKEEESKQPERWVLLIHAKSDPSQAVTLVRFCYFINIRCIETLSFWIVVDQLLSEVQFFVTLWTAACQVPLSSTISQSLLKFIPTESMILSKHLTLCHPLLLLPSVFPNIRVLSNESALPIRWPQYWSFSFSISSSNEESGLISLLSKGLSRVFSNTIVQKYQFFGAQPSL